MAAMSKAVTARIVSHWFLRWCALDVRAYCTVCTVHQSLALKRRRSASESEQRLTSVPVCSNGSDEGLLDRRHAVPSEHLYSRRAGSSGVIDRWLCCGVRWRSRKAAFRKFSLSQNLLELFLIKLAPFPSPSSKADNASYHLL